MPTEHRQAGARGSRSGERPGKERVARFQQMRITTAMTEVATAGGVANVTVGHVTSHAGVSRRTFYELFDDKEDCFLAALEEALARARGYVLAVYRPADVWRVRIRAALTAFLSFLDDEPAMGRLLLVEALGAGPRVLERRAVVLEQVGRILDGGRGAVRGSAAAVAATREPTAATAREPVAAAAAAITTPSASSLTAEGVVGAVHSILHTRLHQGGESRLTELASPLMAMIVLPYLGPAAARAELTRSPPSPREWPRAIARKDPLKGLSMRFTYRTSRVLGAIAVQPGASNRLVGEAAGVGDPGQISKLLTRLEGLGLVANGGGGQPEGMPNAWTLTTLGIEVERAASNRPGTEP